MSQTIISGLVATTPRHYVTTAGLPLTSFRLAASIREWSKERGKFVDTGTSWFTVTCQKQLAINAATSISKGHRIIVSGTLIVRDWDNGERAGTTVELEASNMGHDLAYGSSTFERTVWGNPDDFDSEPVS